MLKKQKEKNGVRLEKGTKGRYSIQNIGEKSFLKHWGSHWDLRKVKLRHLYTEPEKESVSLPADFTFLSEVWGTGIFKEQGLVEIVKKTIMNWYIENLVHVRVICTKYFTNIMFLNFTTIYRNRCFILQMME